MGSPPGFDIREGTTTAAWARNNLGGLVIAPLKPITAPKPDKEWQDFREFIFKQGTSGEFLLEMEENGVFEPLALEMRSEGDAV